MTLEEAKQVFDQAEDTRLEKLSAMLTTIATHEGVSEAARDALKDDFMAIVDASDLVLQAHGDFLVAACVVA